MGASFGMGGIKVNVGSTTKDKTATAEKITANDIGMSYTMGEITLVATSARGKQGTRTDKYSNVGVNTQSLQAFQLWLKVAVNS